MLIRRQKRERAAGDIHRQELRQVRNRRPRAGTRGRILARTHSPGQGQPCPHCQGQHHDRYVTPLARIILHSNVR